MVFIKRLTCILAMIKNILRIIGYVRSCVTKKDRYKGYSAALYLIIILSAV